MKQGTLLGRAPEVVPGLIFALYKTKLRRLLTYKMKRVLTRTQQINRNSNTNLMTYVDLKVGIYLYDKYLITQLPVKIAAMPPESEGNEYILLNFIPSEASISIFGVFIFLFP